MRSRAHSPRGALKALAASLGCLSLLFSVNATAAAADPVWEVNSHHGPSTFQAGGIGEYVFTVENAGDSPTSGPAQIHVELSPGVTTREHFILSGFSTWYTVPLGGSTSGWDCGSPSGGASELTCDSLIDPVLPDGRFLDRGLNRLVVYVAIDPTAAGELTATATVEGGAADPVSIVETATVAEPEDEFGIEASSLQADVFDRDGVPLRQAGAHPLRAVAAFDFNRRRLVPDPKFAGIIPVPAVEPIDTVRSVVTKLPRGFLGDPGAVERCDPLLVAGGGSYGGGCPSSSQVGVIQLMLQSTGGVTRPTEFLTLPVYSLEPPKGKLADFMFSLFGRPVHIYPGLDPSDYSVTVVVPNINEQLLAHSSRLILWGDPSDPVHDAGRWNPETEGTGATFEGERKPFLSLPTECNVPGQSKFGLTSWGEAQAGPYFSEPAEVSGCNQLEFDPTVAVKPTTNVADAPTGLEFDMHIPQNEDPDGLATAHLRDAIVKLPAGMTVNAPSADGLGACSMAQVGIGADGVPTSTTLANGSGAGTPVNCPDASKLGTAVAESPAIDHPIKGEVYLAEQNANPFNSLIAMYLVLEDPETSLLVKLAGRADPDPVTGQITATFRNNPQLPLENLHLEFFQGPRAALKTPDACGTHTTEATLVPWSAPEGAVVSSPSSFELTQGPAGGACLPAGPSAPNTPKLTAGTEDPTAKAFTPFASKHTRADGTQDLKTIEMTLPKGLVGKLAGTTYCSEAALATAATKSGKLERDFPSCPASSRVGAVNVGAGAGSTPLYVQGQAYLAGPYKGAPLSLAVITPAVAGPFDLGTVIVRAALYVDPTSAQIRAVSDEIPQILQGVPLSVRSIALRMDRPNFTLNPTSCDPMRIEGSSLSVFDQPATFSSPFQVGDCNRLGFKPSLSLRLKGGTKRASYPALTALLTAGAGDANIATTSVALPHSAFLAQEHIQTICTRVQFAANQCPAGSVYGKATAWTPLLDQPLTGNAYLRSSSNKLPDLVIALRGQIDIDLIGRIDSLNKGIRTSFEGVPDAPVSKFLLQMQGGKKGLLINSRDICKTTNKATVEMTGQNGAAYESTPLMKAKCPKQRKAKKRGNSKKKPGRAKQKG